MEHIKTHANWFFQWATNFEVWPTAIIAAAAVFISWQQWRLASYKYKADLYDRRLRVYLGVEQFLLDYFRQGLVSKDGWNALSDAASASKFLISNSDYEFLQSIKQKAVRFAVLNDLDKDTKMKVRELISDLNMDLFDEHSKREAQYLKKEKFKDIDELFAINEWILSVPKELESRFEKYLRLTY